MMFLFCSLLIMHFKCLIVLNSIVYTGFDDIILVTQQKHVVHEEDEEEEEEKEVEDDEFPAHNLKDIKKMQFKEMELPDHMDGVRLEIDGHLNKEYNKEIFLGNHEEFEQHSDIKPETLLEQIFHK